MLTSDLIRVRRRRGLLEPLWVSPEDEALLELAATMIAIFDRHAGDPRRLLDAELKDFLGAGTEFLLHRGLAKLLLDRCTFDTEAPIEPLELRRAVFAAATASYQQPEALRFERLDVKASVCKELKIEMQQFEQNLYADLKEEQVLVKFKSCRPEWLLHRYNVALAQAVLLRAARLAITLQDQTPARYRELFGKMKFFRLLHDIRVVEPGHYEVTLDGPLSLFKLSQRYGLQMALFFPSLLHCTKWSLQVDVRWGPKREETKFLLDESCELQPISHSRGQWIPEEVGRFTEQFAKLESEWGLTTEAELIELGGQGVLIPDHVFVHRPSGFKVYMEILGFWRRGSLEARVQLLEKHGPRNLILAVSKELHVDAEDVDLSGEVYLFRTLPIARDVLKLLERILSEKDDSSR